MNCSYRPSHSVNRTSASLRATPAGYVQLWEKQLRSILAVLFMAVAPLASATKVQDMPLKDMVHGATQIAIATSDSVYGRTADGSILQKGQFRTGPGLGNVLVSKMRIVRVLRGSALRKGEVRDVEFWPGWHMDTDLAAKSEHYPVILMLTESEGSLVPVFPPEPWIDGRLEKDVLDLLKAKK